MINNIIPSEIATTLVNTLKLYHSVNSLFEIRILNTKDGICSGIYQLNEDTLNKLAIDIIPYVKHLYILPIIQ